jgi:predicted porin
MVGANTSTGDVNNHVGLGLNFVETFGDVGVRLHGVYGLGDVERDAAAGTAAELDDVGGYMIGGGFSYMGFTVAAGYGDAGDGGIAGNSNADNGSWWDVGIGYSTGPYTLAVGYFAGEESNVAGTADDETDFITIQGQYNVAPGLDVYAELDFIDVDSPTRTAANNPSGSDPTVAVTSNDGMLLILGTRVRF